MFERILKILGYKDQDIRIFIACANLGASPASTIANRVGIKRTTCYQVLENLAERGLIQKSLRQKIRYYEALGLAKLEELLQSSLNDFKTGLELIESNRRTLENAYQKTYGESRISFYEGYEDITHAYEEILDSPDTEILSFLNNRFNIETHPIRPFWEKYLKKRLELKKGSYNLTSGDGERPSMSINEKKLRFTIEVPSSDICTYGDTKISGNRIIIVSQSEGRIFGVMIENAGLSKMFASIFKRIWASYLPEIDMPR